MSTKPAWVLGARQGPLRRHKKIVFFACEGLVAVYDERTQGEDYLVITPDDFRLRAIGLSEMGDKMARGDQTWMRSEGREILQAAQDMMTTVKEAKDMGDPSSPAVQAFWARHRRNSKIVVGLSAGIDKAGYPKLPDLPLGHDTGRTADAGVVLAEPRVRRKPRKKPRGGLVLADEFL